MGSKSNIQWTDDTDNVIVAQGGGWHCVKVSPGCANCYAETMNLTRYYKGNLRRYTAKDAPPLTLRRDLLEKWGRQTKPRKHFVASMTDILGEFVPESWVFEIFDAMLSAPLQTFQVLTKRAERLNVLAKKYCDLRGLYSLPSNIWAMVSVEDQKRVDERIPLLLDTPAWVRGISAEPLLEEIDLIPYLYSQVTKRGDLPKLDWVIIGGESGPGARLFDVAWAERLIAQCRSAEVACFVKQLGRQVKGVKTTDSKGGDISEWPLNIQIRDFPE